MESNARKIHGQAAHSRESGDSLKALQLAEEARIEYAKEGDQLGFAEVHAEVAITLGHISENQKDDFFKKAFLIDARNTAKSGVEIAELSGNENAKAIPYLRYGKAQEALGELAEAIDSYSKAVENMEQNPPQLHNRPGVLADMKIHLNTASYRNGDKQALEQTLSALKDLEESDEAQYNKDVWLSGAHIRIADMLRADNPDEAKKHLDKAKKIIDSNPDLKLRLKQWEKLSENF